MSLNIKQTIVVQENGFRVIKVKLALGDKDFIGCPKTSFETQGSRSRRHLPLTIEKYIGANFAVLSFTTFADWDPLFGDILSWST